MSTPAPNSHPYRLSTTRKAPPMTDEIDNLLKPVGADSDVTAPHAQPIRSGWHANGARLFEVQLRSEFNVRTKRYTKTIILNDELKALEQAREQIDAEIENRKAYLLGLAMTACNITCSGCGVTFATEYDFADHFILTAGPELKNTGDCPNAKRA